MTIDWAQFSPWPALAGGCVIGISASLLILTNGRIAGISGIIGGLLNSGSNERHWRIAFLIGLAFSPLLYRLLWSPPSINIETNTQMTVLAGLLVGLGTRFASGCTSGHGICGIAQLSLRSIIATAVFMSAGLVTVYMLRHVAGQI